MKPKSTLRLLLAATSTLLAISSATAQASHIWENSNVAATPPAALDWFTGGPNTQGTWIGGDPVSSNINTIQFFQGTTTALTNTDAPSTQTVNLNNGGSAFALGTLTLSGLASATTNANLTMTLSGDALNFSAATGTINLNALNATRTITYNASHAIELGTASSGSVLTLTGNGTSAFNFNGIISELQSGGGSLIKSGTSTASLTGDNTYTGTTTVNGGVLNLRGTAGSISVSPGVTANAGGTLGLDNSAGIVNRIKDDATVTLNGSTLIFTGNGSTGSATETIGTLAIGAGGSTITLTGAGASQLQMLDASGFSRTGNGTALIRGTNLQTALTNSTRLALSSSTGLTLIGGGLENRGTSTAGTTTTLSIVPYLMGDASATGTGSSFLTYDESGTLRPLATGEYTTLGAGYTTPGTPENVNAFNGTITTASDVTLNSLRFNGTHALDGSGGALVVNSGAVALTTNAAGSIGSGFSGLTLGNGVWNEGIIHVSQNALTISSSITVTGGGPLIKTGASILVLNATTNSYSGDTIINAGRLHAASDAALGLASGNIILNGGTLAARSNANTGSSGGGGVNLTTARDVVVTSAGGGLVAQGNNFLTTSGKLTGSGTLTLIDPGGGGGKVFNFNATTNDFTGGIILSGAVSSSFNSLTDTANNIAFNGGSSLAYGAGAIAPLTFASGVSGRSIEINSASTVTATIQNNSSLHGISIGNNLIATGAGVKTLALGAVAGPTNLFSGDISNGTGGGSVAISKTGAGTWAVSGNMSHTGGLVISGGALTLSGTNTYSGNTNFNAGGTTLAIAGSQAASPNTTFVMNTNASTSDSTLKILDDTGGVNGTTITLPNTITIQNNNAPGNAHTYIVGNNNTANGGTSSGTTTGSTIAISTLNWGSYATGTTAYGPIQIRGTDGYRLQFDSVTLHNAANITSPTVGNTFFTPTTANVTLGTVTVGTGNTGQGYQTLVLDGTSSDNRVTGAISNASDIGISNRPLSVTKSNTSTWTLSGTNTYTGGTTITTGKLVFSGANALPTTGTIAVGANGHLSLTDGVARNQTVSALTLASGANLSFDWTGSGTGDQLTSTADITPTAGSNIAVNLNLSGTPGGSVTLLTGGAGSTLDTSNFYLANATNYSATLTTPTADTLVLSGYTPQTPLTTIYWAGNKLAGASTAGVDNSWTLSSGTTSNWSSTDTSYTGTALTPDSTANVIFSNTLSGRAQQSTVLGADVTINSLVIADSTAVTIAGANGAALTLMSNLSTAGLVDGTPGSAITVTSTANATTTISSGINLGSNQTWNVASGKTLTVGGEVSGNFSLTKADAGTLILNGTNTYAGDTTINAGILRIGNNTAGTLGGGNYTGNIVNNGTLQIWSSANQNLSGVISGPGDLSKAYGGTLTLAGNNTYTGKTLLQPQTTAGFTLNVSSFNSVNGGTPLMTSSSLGAPTTVENGTIEFGSGSAQAGVNITYTGPGETTDRILRFNMNGNGATKTIDASGSGLLKFTSTFTKTGSNTNDFTLQGSGNGEAVGGLDFVFRNFTKAGSGTWTLGGPVGNTGTTTISGGTLVMNGTQSASGAFAVNGTSTLAGSGSIGGATTVATTANLSPGAAAVGTLTFQNNLTISAMAGSTGLLFFNLGPIAASDKIAVSGTLDIGTDVLGFNDFNFTTGGGLANGTYKLITSTTRTGSLDPANLTGPVGSGIGTLQISDGGTGNDIELVVTGIGGGDTTPPTLVSITDNVSGGPVNIGQTVTYIVTFDEDMDDTSVTAADFGNNGTAGANIGAVTESSPGVFSVPVTATSPGTLVLRINEGAVLSDVALNALDTTPALLDDTTITVRNAYQTWALANAISSAPGQDKDGDGVTNAIEFLLGGSVGTNDLGKLPKITMTATDMIITFERIRSSTDGITGCEVEVGTTLAAWSNSYTVGATTAGSDPEVVVAENSPSGFDTITVTIAKGLDPAKFARLNVSVTP